MVVKDRTVVTSRLGVGIGVRGCGNLEIWVVLTQMCVCVCIYIQNGTLMICTLLFVSYISIEKKMYVYTYVCVYVCMCVPIFQETEVRLYSIDVIIFILYF